MVSLIISNNIFQTIKNLNITTLILDNIIHF